VNDATASNIRRLREHLTWTQEQLAEAARINVRTVQRAEEGRGLSSETLLAIAGAFDVDVDALRTDPLAAFVAKLGVAPDEVTDELIAAKAKELLDTYTMIPVTPVASSADFNAVFSAQAVMFECDASDDPVLDLAAELKQYVTDVMDLKGDLGAVQQRDCAKEAFAIVQRLSKLKYAVSIGARDQRLKLRNGEPLDLNTLYVLVVPEDRHLSLLAIEKGARLQFA
jgi:transcriptional regulator with XRE-family HTH domain